MRSGRHTFFVLLLTLLVGGCADPAHYRVQPGDTLYSISWRYAQDVGDVAAWNKIGPPYLIHEGDWLRVLPPPPPGDNDPHAAARDAAPSPSQQPTKSASNTKKPRVVTATKPVLRPKPTTKSRTVTKIRRNPVPVVKAQPPINKGPVAWRWPTASKRVLRTFSTRNNDLQGIDLAGRPGDAVRAAASGRVVYSGAGLLGYGQMSMDKC
jgi:lipoprotein NlpD